MTRGIAVVAALCALVLFTLGGSSVANAADQATGGGSCGYATGKYGFNEISPVWGQYSTAARVFWQAVYNNVPIGASVKVMQYSSANLTDWVATFGQQAVAPSGGFGSSYAIGGGATGGQGLWMFRIMSNGDQIGSFSCAVLGS